MRFTHFLAISLCGIANVACQMEEIEVPREELFTRAFIKEFGIPDPDQDWNVATRVTANVDPALVRGAETICVYDCMPGGPDCQLAARFSASTTTFDFDFAKGNTSAYVRGENADGSIVFSGFYPIENGILRVSSGSSRAIEYAPATTIKIQRIDHGNWGKGIGAFNFNTYNGEGSPSCNLEYWKALHPDWAVSSDKNKNFKDVLSSFKLYGLHNGDFNSNYITGKFDAEEEGTPCSSLSNIVGKNGVFHEGVVNKSCNLNKYASLLNPEEGVTYTSKGGEIILKYIYGAGIFSNSFGYFYYKDGASMQEIMEAPKFILMYDASPWNNLQRQNGQSYETFENIGGKGVGDTENKYKVGIDNFSGMKTANDIEAYESDNGNNASLNIKYKPSYHKLVYYPLNSDNEPIEGQATYEFPEGLKIGFFLLVQGHEKMKRDGNLDGIGNSNNNGTWKVDGTDFRFSLPWMNQLYGSYYKSNSDHGTSPFNNKSLNVTLKNGSSVDIPASYVPGMSFVTYMWNGETVMGVEDGMYQANDHDMNDIIFLVRGVENDQEEVGEKPKAQSWVIACEDLGGSHDFDFNDVVFGVSHFSTDDKKQNYLKIKALAAGGTLPVQLFWTDNKNVAHNVGTSFDQHYQYWNNWFGENQGISTVINCYDSGSFRNNGGVVTIPLDDYDDYSIAHDHFKTNHGLDAAEAYRIMGGFSLAVYDPNNLNMKPVRSVYPIGNYENFATSEYWNNAPQMILVDAKWKWPIECKPVFDAYKGDDGSNFTGSHGEKMTSFSQWVQNKNAIEWTNQPTNSDWVVKHDEWLGESVETKQ